MSQIWIRHCHRSDRKQQRRRRRQMAEQTCYLVIEGIRSVTIFIFRKITEPFSYSSSSLYWVTEDFQLLDYDFTSNNGMFQSHYPHMNPIN